jgi:Domain of unknown function (DUF4390)
VNVPRKLRCALFGQSRGRAGLTALAAVLGFGFAAHGQSDPGRFEVRTAADTLRDDVYFLSARIDLRLSTEAREALESGLPLTIRLEVQLLNRLRLWWDLEEWTLVQLYQLEHNALTERYIVRRLNSGDQASFPTLFLALNYIGQIEDLPVIDAAVLDADRRYDIRIRVVLDQEQLPGPLRLLAFWRRDWSLGSEWYRWRLDED